MQLLKTAAILTLAGLAGAQDRTIVSSIADGTTPRAMAPGSPLGSYLVSNIDHVDLYSGKLAVAVPLLEVGGRGDAKFTLTARAFQPTWTVNVTSYSQDISILDSGCNPNDVVCYRMSFDSEPTPRDLVAIPPDPGYGPGLMYIKRAASDYTRCYNVNSNTKWDIFGTAFSYLVFLEPDGTEHALYDAGSLGISTKLPYPCSNANDYNGTSRGPFVSRDGSGMTFTGDGVTDTHDPERFSREQFSLGISGTLHLKNGTKYTIHNGLVQSIADRNGNTISFAYIMAYGYSTTLVQDITDPLGRNIHIDYGGSIHTITFKGDAGNFRYIKIKYQDVSERLRLSAGESATDPVFPDLTSAKPISLYSLTVLSEIYRSTCPIRPPTGPPRAMPSGTTALPKSRTSACPREATWSTRTAVGSRPPTACWASTIAARC